VAEHKMEASRVVDADLDFKLIHYRPSTQLDSECTFHL
jgi:hypothetical protein